MGALSSKLRRLSGSGSSTGTHHRKREDRSMEESSRPLSMFQGFLQDIAPEIEENNSKLAIELKDGVHQILNRTVLLLKHVSFFDGCYCRIAGSVGEGSKLGLPLEQDYMLVIPIFEDQRIFRIVAPKGQRYKYVEASNEASLVLGILLQNSAIQATKVVSGGALVPLVTSALGTAISENFSSWKMDKYCVKKSVITFHLVYVNTHQSEYHVSLDLCLGFKSNHKIPQTVDELISRRIQKADSQKKGGLKKVLPLSYFVYLSPKLPNLGTSASALENFYLNSLGRENNRMRCYCYAKYFVGLFLPLVRAKADKCVFCDETLIPSYYLKLCLISLIEQNDSDDYWSRDNLPNRLIELFTTLLTSINTDETLQSILIPNDPYVDKEVEKKFREAEKRFRALASEHGCIEFTPIPTVHAHLKTSFRKQDCDLVMPAFFTDDNMFSGTFGEEMRLQFGDYLKNSLAEETVYVGPILERFCEVLKLLNRETI